MHGRYQTLQMIAHEVIMRMMYSNQLCSLLFQNASPNRESYFIAIG